MFLKISAISFALQALQLFVWWLLNFFVDKVPQRHLMFFANRSDLRSSFTRFICEFVVSGLKESL